MAKTAIEMKTKFTLLITLILLIGCNTQKKKEDERSQSKKNLGKNELADILVMNDTLFFNNHEIRVLGYKTVNDTFFYAYFDENTIRYREKAYNNLGAYSKDLTFDSISHYIWNRYPKKSFAIYATNLNSAKFIHFDNKLTINDSSGITQQYYWAEAINYFEKKIQRDSSDFDAYFNLAKSYYEFHNHFTSYWQNDYIIELLDIALKLNPYLEKAYFFKAHIHERIARQKYIMAEGRGLGADSGEIDKAIELLNELLKFNPDNIEAKEYRKTLMSKYR